jgi:hypothetical protein
MPSGPLEVREGTSGHACLYFQGTNFNVALGMRHDNARLMAHHANHFDAVLTALRGARSAFQYYGLFGDAATTDAAVVAAQEVK